MNRISKIIVFILLFGLGMVLGWYTSQKLSKGENTVVTSGRLQYPSADSGRGSCNRHPRPQGRL